MTDTHAVSIELAVTADRAYAFMTDPKAMDRWSFGTWKIVLHEGGLVEGSSIFDGSVTWVKIDGDRARGTIDYFLGKDPSALTPRIMAKVIPGDRLDLGADNCVLSMIAWRPRNMPHDRWKRLVASHEFEVFLLKSLIEAS